MAKTRTTDDPSPPSDEAGLRDQLAPILGELAELIVLKKLHAERVRAFGLTMDALRLIGSRLLGGDDGPALMSRALEAEAPLTLDQAVVAIRGFLDGPLAANGRVPGNIVKFLTKLLMDLFLTP